MTRDEIIELKPGWSSNLLIAEKVMGWRWVRGNHFDVTGFENPIWLLPPDMSIADVPAGQWTYYSGDKPLDHDDRLTIFDVPNYFGDMGKAWLVVERMYADHKGVRLALMHDYDGWYAKFANMGIEQVPWLVTQCKTAPEAICKAALEIVRQRESNISKGL